MTDLITAEEAGKLLDGPLLTGLVNEHRALLLQVIGTDDADAMAYSKDGKPIRRVREITSPAKQAAEVIGNLARTVIALHAQLADAQAAQAMAVGRAEEKRFRATVKHDGAEVGDLPWLEEFWAVRHDDIRDLAPIDGLALVRELRDRAEKAEAERDAAREALMNAGVALHVSKREATEAKADRDRLAAANAVLEAKVAGLVEAARPFLKTAVLADSASLLRAVNGIRAALATQEGNPV